MATTYRAQFWAPYRGRVDVPFIHPADRGLDNITADMLAEAIVKVARQRFADKWPLGQDRIHLVGIEDTKTGQQYGLAGKPLE